MLTAVFTYVAPLLIEETDLVSALPLMLLLFGVGGAAGMVLGGRLGDWKPLELVAALSVAYALFYVALIAVIDSVILVGVAMIVWGFLFLAPCVPLQTRVVRKAIDGPNLASTLNQSATPLAPLGTTLLTRRFRRLRLSRVALDRERPHAPLRRDRPIFSRARARRTSSGRGWTSRRASLRDRSRLMSRLMRLDFGRPTRFHFFAADV